MSETAAKIPVLTPREQEIMKPLLDGSSPKEIASVLNINHDTVLAHKKTCNAS